MIAALGKALLAVETTLGPFGVGTVMRALPATHLAEVLRSLAKPDAARLRQWMGLQVRERERERERETLTSVCGFQRSDQTKPVL